ncbi:MAG: 50S ribosomal protein L21 [Parachlamydia sp.]|nr:50S ribosomal protein L21 [Parachlamydia acanthamoebae]
MKMYAIIKTGGKQYRVAKDATIDVELLDATPGSVVEFREVLLVNDGASTTVGQPHVSNYLVKGEYLETVLGDKVVSVKYKKRQNQRRKFGHRQKYARIRITEIAAV